MRGAILWMVAMIAGCSAVLGIEDLHPPTIHGTVRDMAADTVSNVSVALHRDQDGIPIAAATTDGKGRFEFPVTERLPLDVYLELADPNFVRTFSHLTQPADGLRMLASGAGQTQGPGRSVVIAQVVDAGGSALTGATVQAEAGVPPTSVAHICYTDPSTGFPCAPGAPGATRDDGKAWLFDVPETTKLHITAVDADGKLHEVEFAVVAEPSLVFTPVPPRS
jgi:hypothetical protein